MDTINMNKRFENTREKAARLIREGKTEQASEAWSSFLDALVSYKSWDQIKKFSETCIRQLPGTHVGYLTAGIACLNTEKFKEAIKYFSKVLELQPGNLRALQHKSEAHFLSGQNKMALRIAKELRETDLYNPKYILLEVNCLTWLDRHEEALYLVEEGLLVNPDDCRLLIEKALGADFANMPDVALENYSKAESLNREKLLSPRMIETLVLLRANRGSFRFHHQDKPGGTDEQNMGNALMELEKTMMFEYRSN